MRSMFLKLRVLVVPLLLVLAQACVADDVVVEDVELVTTDGGYELYLEPEPLVGELGGLKLHWSAPRDHNAWDIIGLFPEGGADNEAITSGYVGGQGEIVGVHEITLPNYVLADPRRIEIRVISRADGRTVATSNAVTPAHTYEVSVVPDDPARAGLRVTAGWHAPTMHPGDWIGLYQVGAPNDQRLTWWYIGWGSERSGTMQFTLPDPAWGPGPYEFRLFVAGTLGLVAVSGPIVRPE